MRSTRTLNYRRLLLFLGTTLLFAASLARPSESAAAPDGGIQNPLIADLPVDSQIKSDANLRAALGIGPALPRTPTDAKRSTRIGLEMTDQEATNFDRWVQEVDAVSPTLDRFVSDGTITSWYPDLSLKSLKVHVFSTLTESASKRLATNFPNIAFEIRSTPNSAQALDTAFGAIAALLHPNLDVPVGSSDRTSFDARALVETIRSLGFEPIGVTRSPFVDRVILTIPDSDFDSFPGNISEMESRLGSELSRLVTFRPGTGLKKTQATSETRLTWTGLARSGKRMNMIGGFCTSGPIVFDQNSGQRYVMTAGHCQTAGSQASADAAGVVGSYVVNSRCDYCAWGVDAVLFAIPSWTASNQFIWQPNGWWDGSIQQQGQTYLDLMIGATPAASGMNWVCLEGSSPDKYSSNQPGVDARSTCGISFGRDGTGMREVHLYDDNAICGGDSGGLVRRPTGYGGSWTLGLVSARGHSQHPVLPDCSQRVGGSSYPAGMWFSEFELIRNRFLSSPGVNLAIVV